jgi:hypothetical protein
MEASGIFHYWNKKFSAILISSFSNICIRSFQHVHDETGKTSILINSHSCPFLIQIKYVGNAFFILTFLKVSKLSFNCVPMSMAKQISILIDSVIKSLHSAIFSSPNRLKLFGMTMMPLFYIMTMPNCDQWYTYVYHIDTDS